jgi:hypothetical protein
VVSRDLPQAMPQLDLLQFDHLAPMAMGAAVLAHHTSGQPLRNPEACAQDLNSPAPTFRAQKFPVAPQGPTASLREGFAYAEAKD